MGKKKVPRPSSDLGVWVFKMKLSGKSNGQRDRGFVAWGGKYRAWVWKHQRRNREAAEINRKNPRDLVSRLGPVVKSLCDFGQVTEAVWAFILSYDNQLFDGSNLQESSNSHSRTANERDPIFCLGRGRLGPTLLFGCSFIHSPPHNTRWPGKATSPIIQTANE